MKKLLLYGGGGRCRETISILVGDCGYQRADMHVVDEHLQVGSDVAGVNVVSNHILDPVQWGYKPAVSICCIGGLTEMRTRYDASERLLEAGYQLATVIAGSSDVAGKIAPGAYVGRFASVGAGSRVEEGATINSHALVHHDCTIGAYAHVGPGAVLCGNVVIGKLAIVGPGATVCAGVMIGDDALIGAGATVVHDVESDTRVAGTPAIPF